MSALSGKYDFQQALDDLEALSGYGVAFHSRGLPRISETPGDGGSADHFTPAGPRRSEDHRHHRCAFCLLVKASKKGMAACLQCDPQEGHTLAGRARGTVARRCHAGLDEVLKGVFFEGRHVGTLFGGQARRAVLAPAEQDVLRRHWTELGLDPDEAARLFGLLPVSQGKKLASLGRMLTWLAELAERRVLARAAECAKSSTRSTPIAHALAFMAGHLDQPLTLAAVARQVHLSPSRLSHLFSALEGRSFRARLAELRVERAKDLLLHSSLPVKDVAARVGCVDPDYFCRLFAKREHISPGRYRRKALGLMGV